MPNHSFDHLIAPAVGAVLETMFFSAPLGPSDPAAGASTLEARVTFSGEVSGVLGVRISADSARNLAASFLGEFEDSLTDAQIAQVVCELANMLCGWIVSEPEFQGSFEIGIPELVSPGSEQLLRIPAVERSFAVESGTLTVLLYTSACV